MWNAYYSLEPYGGILRAVTETNAILIKSDPSKLMPPECKLNNPLEDLVNSKAHEADLIRQMNSLALGDF